jgi:hypothetical protein
MGMFTDASTNPSFCRVPRLLPEKEVSGVGKPFYVGPSPSCPPALRGFGAERNPPSLGLKSVIKGLKILPTTQLEKIRPSSATSVCLTELQQKRTGLRIPAQSHKYRPRRRAY